MVVVCPMFADFAMVSRHFAACHGHLGCIESLIAAKGDVSLSLYLAPQGHVSAGAGGKQSRRMPSACCRAIRSHAYRPSSFGPPSLPIPPSLSPPPSLPPSLYLLVSSTRLQTSPILQEAGVPPFAQSHNGRTPLHVACLHGR
eukprot:767106-Hanusia_phi.AAC.1